MLKGLKKKEKGFASIVEVAVTAVIFVLATAGILTTISNLRPHSEGSSKAVEAAYIGKGIIDDLRRQVHATPGSFYGADLTLGDHSLTSGDYTINYTVTDATTNLRQLDMTITWPD